VRIALTGGIACGKSLFSRILRELGVATIDADDIVHGLESSGGKAVPLISEKFGSDILNSDGSVNRPALAEKVFASPSSRKDLEAILFPMVKEEIDRFLSSPQTPGVKFSLAVIPLLFESQWHSDYDIIISLVSSPENMIRRMMETRGYSRQQALARISAQMSVEEKAKRSHYTILNNSTYEELYADALRLVDSIQERLDNGRNPESDSRANSGVGVCRTGKRQASSRKNRPQNEGGW
jgi:dephospho-CoA kinase